MSAFKTLLAIVWLSSLALAAQRMEEALDEVREFACESGMVNTVSVLDAIRADVQKIVEGE